MAHAITDAAASETDVEAWALRYITSERLVDKLDPPAPPAHFSGRATVVPEGPGRPPELRITQHAPRRKGLSNPRARAELLHTFLHHELQAAELMCWAILRFADAPVEFRRGLLGICLDEVRHMKLYAGHIEALGAQRGRVPRAGLVLGAGAARHHARRVRRVHGDGSRSRQPRARGALRRALPRRGRRGRCRAARAGGRGRGGARALRRSLVRDLHGHHRLRELAQPPAAAHQPGLAARSPAGPHPSQTCGDGRRVPGCPRGLRGHARATRRRGGMSGAPPARALWCLNLDAEDELRHRGRVHAQPRHLGGGGHRPRGRPSAARSRGCAAGRGAGHAL
ncbi:MAG: DUF455 family protein [Sandaracinaceae bacterium]|nr:DUF455 family protein [Sandaracinaceae bacterium]